MQRDERRLKIGSNADTSNDLKDDDFCPVGFGVKINEQTESECHDCHAEPDGWEVFAGFLDESTGCAGHEGEGKSEREQVDAGEKRRGAQDGLEVEG